MTIIPEYGAPMASGGNQTALNLSSTTVVKTGPGRVASVSVIVPAAAICTINDCATTGAAANSNAVFAIPASATGNFLINFPCFAGITVAPGAGVTLAINFA